MCCAGLAVSKYWPAVPLVPSERPQPFTAVGWVQVGPRAKGGSPPVPSERPQPFACVRAVGWAQVGPHILPPSATFPRTAPQYCSHWARGAGVWLSTARQPCTLSIQKKQSSAALRHWRPPVSPRTWQTTSWNPGTWWPTERAPPPLSTADDPAAYRKDVVFPVPEPAAGTRRYVTAAHPLADNRPRTDSQSRPRRHTPPRPLSLGPVRTPLHPPSPLRDTLGAFAPAMRPTATLMQQEEELESLATPTEDDDTVTAAAATHEVHAPGKVRKTRKLHLRTCSRRHPLAALPRLRPCFLSGAPCRGLGHGGGILVGLGRR